MAIAVAAIILRAIYDKPSLRRLFRAPLSSPWAHILPRRQLRLPSDEAEMRMAARLIASRKRDQRARHGSVTICAKTHRCGGRFTRRSPGAAEKLLPGGPIVTIGLWRWPFAKGRYCQREAPRPEIVD